MKDIIKKLTIDIANKNLPKHKERIKEAITVLKKIKNNENYVGPRIIKGLELLENQEYYEFTEYVKKESIKLQVDDEKYKYDEEKLKKEALIYLFLYHISLECVGLITHSEILEIYQDQEVTYKEKRD